MKRLRYIGTKKFYKMVLAIALPIMIQNGITNLVSMIDNIMVGQIGTNQMSAVSIINQLLFVFNLCMFGGMAGAGIYTAQYHGKNDHEGIRYTFRYKVWSGLIMLILGVAILLTLGTPMVNNFLDPSNDPEDIAVTLQSAQIYLSIMLIGLLPFSLKEVYSSTLRETGEAMMPMKAGIYAVFTNIVLNFILIYGYFGLPAMGVAGAAIATVISRFVELFILAGWTHLHSKKNKFIVGAYSSLKLPVSLAKQIFIKGTPLLLNEALWSSGNALLLQCYSVKGLVVIAGMNIASVINNVFNVGFIALGVADGIIVGKLLGAKKMNQARYTVEKLICFSVVFCVMLGMIMVCIAPLFPKIYNTSLEAKNIATSVILIYALFMPVWAFTNATYFTLRSGGKTILTFIFDSGFMWVLQLPVIYYLTKFTALPIIPIVAIAQSFDIIKCFLGYFMIKKGIWVNNIVNEDVGI